MFFFSFVIVQQCDSSNNIQKASYNKLIEREKTQLIYDIYFGWNKIHFKFKNNWIL